DVLSAGIDGQHDVWPVTADDAGDLFHKVASDRVLQHAIVILQPGDVLLRDAEHAAGFLFFVHADVRQPFASHLRIVRALVIIGVNDNADGIVLCQQRQRAGAAKGFVVRVRSEDQDGFSSKVFETRLGLCRKQTCNRGAENEKEHNWLHELSSRVGFGARSRYRTRALTVPGPRTQALESPAIPTCKTGFTTLKCIYAFLS